MVQLPLQPAYGLTVHKVQALTIAHIVRGCLEGVFAAGSLYVLISRVTDPRNLELIGLPPADLLDDVAEELVTSYRCKADATAGEEVQRLVYNFYKAISNCTSGTHLKAPVKP